MATINGTTRDDTLTGTSVADIISGFAGNDSINAGAGADFVSGGLGDDIINGGLGNDTMYGGDGADTLNGGAGNDLIYAGNDEAPFANDVVDGGAGNDGFAFDKANFAAQADGGVNVVNFQVGQDYFIATGTGNTLYYNQEWDDFHQALGIFIGDGVNTVVINVTGANLTGELSSDYFVGMTAL